MKLVSYIESCGRKDEAVFVSFVLSSSNVYNYIIVLLINKKLS